MATNSEPILITRVFNASLADVWKSWTAPEKIKQWWGPKDYTAPTIKCDVRVGGVYLFAMKSPENKTYWSTGTYKEVAPHSELVFTDSFADENGNVVSSEYYDMPGIPKELLVTVKFEEQGSKTKMTLKHEGFPPGEIADMCKIGWNESFDKLEKTFFQGKEFWQEAKSA
ncbi:SRPBCC domain-containing protein [Bdellovibrio sp. ArHS]|uniref:SRPBCC family protein n=1 Tax=Bdellovibrio sp. ArHS TaxID=1569284 RepID=UPI000AF65414|nr:SRPBCC domain-containing protein [Bdellovibrio sp. ArHS]